MTLVDSGVWIDYLNGKTTAQTEMLAGLLGQEEVVIGDLILTEILQGFADEAEFNAVRSRLSSFRVVDLGGEKVAVQAARNYRFLRSLGITIRGLVDAMIATRCIQDGYSLLHNDRDFTPFVKHLGLRERLRIN